MATRPSVLAVLGAVSLLAMPASGLSAQDTEVSSGAQAPTQPVVYRAQRATSSIEVDGVLEEPAWAAVEPIRLDYEWFPGELVPPPVTTEALLMFDEKHIYLAFRAWDPDPSQIRAQYMDRDDTGTMAQNDTVSIHLDPFNDERRGFVFRVNALGVQADGVYSQIDRSADFSWDAIWDSACRITDWGFVAEIAIPVSQLRFPSTDAESLWGVALNRRYPRSVVHYISDYPRDLGQTCILCQFNKVTGFEGLVAGRNLKLDPTLTLSRVDQQGQVGDPSTRDEKAEAGLTVRWSLTPAITLNATVNPDFSQVEADSAQLEVNERFALLYPEKRPFFLEGGDLFGTPINAVFTRTVVDPKWGMKLSGKLGRHAGGLFVTRDTATALLIPSNQGSASAFLEEDLDGAVVRYRGDLGSSVNLGLLYAGRQGTGYHNHLGGLDGYFRLSSSDEVRLQYLRSDTLYPKQVVEEHDQPSSSLGDDALSLSWQHEQRDWYWAASYESLGPRFRADSGFVPRVDVRTASGWLGRTFWMEPEDWLVDWSASLGFERTEDHTGQLTDERLRADLVAEGPWQSLAFVRAQTGRQLYDGRLYDGLHELHTRLEAQPNTTGKYSLRVTWGKTIDFSNSQPADSLVLQPSVELKLGRHLNVEAFHIRQRLGVEDGTLSTARLSQLRLVYSFGTRCFVRLLGQYLDLTRDATLFVDEVADRSRSLASQLLFSYKLNPQTALFVGYSESRSAEGDAGLSAHTRALFVKLGYAWLP